jgi:hypothetical protein
LSCGLEPLPIHVVHDSLTEMSPKEFVYIIRSQIVTSKADVLDLLIKPKLGFSDVCSQCDHGDCLDHLCPCALSKGGHYFYTEAGCLNEAWSESEEGGSSSFISECNDSCGCSRTCGNRVVQRGMKYEMEVSRNFLCTGSSWATSMFMMPELLFLCTLPFLSFCWFFVQRRCSGQLRGKGGGSGLKRNYRKEHLFSNLLGKF